MPNLKAFIILFFCGVWVYSQNNEVVIDTTKALDLEQVIITATRTERQLSSLPLPATIVSNKIIEQSGSVRLNEIINEQTGILTVADESGFEGVQIQGIASDYVLVLIDGVPLVGRSAGNFDLTRLTVGNIKQIEVVKGPSSSLYGSEALGGVINIITEKPKNEDLKGNASYRFGTFTQQDINVGLKQKVNKLRYSFFANRFSSEGYDLTPENEEQTVNPFENYTLNARSYFDFTENVTLFTSLRYFHQNQEANLFLEEDTFKGNTEENEWNAHARLDHNINDQLRLEYELYFTNYRANEILASPITSDLLSNNNFNQTLARPEIRGIFTSSKNGTITTGIGYQWETLDRTFFDSEVTFNSQYAYVQWDTYLFSKLNLIGGIRFDNHSEYNNQLSPKLALLYPLSKQTNLKASIGYGFKAPDFRQLYFDFTNSTIGYTVLGYNVATENLLQLQQQGQLIDILIPLDELDNPLQAERSVGYNLGVTHKLHNWKTEVNLFRNDISNLIDTRIIARKTNGQNVFSYQNFDEIFTTGGEINVTYEPIKNISLNAGYQLLYAFDKERRTAIKNNEVFARDPQTNETIILAQQDYFGLINRSRHTANFKVFYNLPKISSNLNCRVIYRSRFALFDTNGNNLIDNFDNSFINGFATVNMAASKTFYKDLTLQIGANNIFNFTNENLPNLPGVQSFIKLNYQF